MSSFEDCYAVLVQVSVGSSECLDEEFYEDYDVRIEIYCCV